jgi:hypothetical protein
MTFDPASMTNVTLVPSIPFEFGDILYENVSGTLIALPTLDDAIVGIPMNGNDFYMFGYNAGAAGTIVWNTNNAIFFGPSPYQGPLVNFGPTSGYIDPSGRGFKPVTGNYILLGNHDRRTTSFYTSNYTTMSNKYFICKIVVYFDDYYAYSVNGSGRVIPPATPPPQGIFTIRLIRELIGQKRQWIEVTVNKSPPSPGYSTNPSITYPSNTNQAKDANGNFLSSPYNGQPQDANGDLIDPTKISPYDICNGSTLINACGNKYSDVSPATGTTFIFQSDTLGYSWFFTDQAYLNV